MSAADLVPPCPRCGDEVPVHHPRLEHLRMLEWRLFAEASAVTWAFASPTGEPYDDSWLRGHVWAPLLRRAGLRHRGTIRNPGATSIGVAGINA